MGNEIVQVMWASAELCMVSARAGEETEDEVRCRTDSTAGNFTPLAASVQGLRPLRLKRVEPRDPGFCGRGTTR